MDVLNLGTVRQLLAAVLGCALCPALMLYWNRDSDSLQMALGRLVLVAGMLLLLGVAGYVCATASTRPGRAGRRPIDGGGAAARQIKPDAGDGAEREAGRIVRRCRGDFPGTSRDAKPAMAGVVGFLAPLGILDVLLVRTLDMPLPGALAVIAAINLAAGAGLVWYRWQAMCKAPNAVPAGRIQP